MAQVYKPTLKPSALMKLITSVVAENTTRVLSVFNVPVEEIQKQIDAVFEDIHVDAVKLGMLPTA